MKKIGNTWKHVGKNLNAKFTVQYSIYWVHIQTNVTPEHSNTHMNWIIQLIDKTINRVIMKILFIIQSISGTIYIDQSVT